MKKHWQQLIVGLILMCTISACSKESEQLNLVTVKELCPLQVGKVYYYRMDSSILNSSYSAFVIKYYHVKDSVSQAFLDNTNRPSFTIFRYLRDTLNTQPWKYAATYYVTQDTNRIETLDNNNLRFVSLASPARNGITWNGTSNIHTSYPLDYFANWQFTYQNCGNSFATKKGTINDTYTVLQVDDTTPSGPLTGNNFQIKNYSMEVYGKGIGLIYKEYMHYNYQTGFFQQESWGIKLNLIDYK